MISVEEAKSILVKNVSALMETMRVKLIDALGCKLTEDIFSPLDLPSFDQSNVDGYAVKFSPGGTGREWKVIGEIKAGDNVSVELKAGEAMRIFTGAMVPVGSDAVIMQEKIERKDNNIHSVEPVLKKGEHIRGEGSQIKKGELALPKGTLINAATIGFLNGLGFSEVSVYRKPQISIIVTGNELQEAGSLLEKGKVYECNSSTLRAALLSAGLNTEEIVFVKDDKKSLADAVESALKKSDLLLISGGISVGDYDFVNEVLSEYGTATLFYKVAQKPGKPLYFGKNKNTFVFGLPGNPSSALTCFYEYVYPVIRKMQGRENIFLESVQAPLLKDIQKKKGLANFLKAKLSDKGIESLNAQESFMMRSFAEANAFIYLPLESENVKAGEIVEAHLFPEI